MGLPLPRVGSSHQTPGANALPTTTVSGQSWKNQKLILGPSRMVHLSVSFWDGVHCFTIPAELEKPILGGILFLTSLLPPQSSRV